MRTISAGRASRVYITSNAQSLAATMTLRTERYLAEIGAATRQNAKLVYEMAQQLSQTRYFSLETLALMGHPYSRRYSNPPLRAAIVNRQSGQLYRGWRWTYTRQPDGWLAVVYNSSAHARYMPGTTRMIPRPIIEEALQRTENARRGNMGAARKRGLEAARASGLVGPARKRKK